MIEYIQRLLANISFHPFTIVTSGGEHYRVASRDHAGFSPEKKWVVVWFDDSSHVTVSPLHITAIKEEHPSEAQAA